MRCLLRSAVEYDLSTSAGSFSVGSASSVTSAVAGCDLAYARLIDICFDFKRVRVDDRHHRPAGRGPAEDCRRNRLTNLGVFGNDQPSNGLRMLVYSICASTSRIASLSRVHLLRRGFNLCLEWLLSELRRTEPVLRRREPEPSRLSESALDVTRAQQIRLSRKLERTLLHVCLGLSETGARLLQLGFGLEHAPTD